MGNQMTWWYCMAVVMAVVVTWQAGSVAGNSRSYSIILESIEMKENTIFKQAFLKLVIVNRTNYANFTFNLPKDLPDDVYLTVAEYEKKGNGYSPIPLPLANMPLCEYVKKPKLMYSDILRASNLPDSCKWPAGDYYVKNYKPDVEKLPENLPGEAWRLELAFTCKGKKLLRIYLDFKIKRHN